MSLRFAPYRQIASEAAARLCDARGGDPLAPWPEEVIVPSRGMAEAIVSRILERMPLGLAGLPIRTLEELARDLATSGGLAVRVASDAERRLAMRTAVRSIEDPMMESRGVAAMLERAYRDVRDSGIPLSELSQRARGLRGLRNARRTELILRAWTEYERLIARLGCVDPADLLQQAAGRMTPALRPQLLAGFYDMTGAQLGLAEALRKAGRLAAVWVPTAAPFAQRLVTRLFDPARTGVDFTPEPPHSITLTEFDTPVEEARGVCARVAELLARGVPAAGIGIVARSFDAYDRSLLRRFAAEQGFRTTLAGEIPLTAHRIGRGAVTLLRLRDRGFPRSEVLELVRDGLHTKARIHVDVVDAAARRARIAGGTSDELSRIRNRPSAVDDYIALVAELEEKTATLDLSLLAQLGSAFRIETETDLEAAERLDEIALLFRRAASWNRGLDAASVIDAIEQETLRPRVEQSLLPSVWTGEILRFRGRSFTHLFVLRMQDEVFPQRRIEDPLLPDSDRRLLGIREIGDGLEEEELLFSLLGDAASMEVHYSFAAGDGLGKVLRRSRFVRELRAQTKRIAAAAPAPPALGRRRSLQLIVRAGTRSPFDGYIGPLASERLQALSPTQLEDFGECPQKFLLKHLLGVTDFDDPERELQIHHREKGVIDHRILERFYRSTGDEELARAAAALPHLPAEITGRLEMLIDEQFDELERIVPPFNRTVRGIERRATKRILRDFLAADLADLAAQQLTPRWFEYRFGAKHRQAADHPEPFVVDAGGVPVRVEGTIDRIDAGPGRYRIVDYKSGKALRHVNLGDKIDRGVRLQLALYAMAVTEFFAADPAKVQATIKPLVAGEKLDKFAFELAEKREGLLETLGIFIRAIQRGDFPAFPNENDNEFNSCKYCPVSHSCRTKHEPEERYVLQQLRDPRTLLGDPR